MAEHRITNYIAEATRAIKFLHRPGGRGLLHSMTNIMDRVLGDTSLAAREAMLRECSDAALPYHARNSGDRPMLGESVSALRRYLWQRWDANRRAGTQAGMAEQLARLGITRTEFWSHQALKLAGVPGNVAFGGPAQLGFFFVIIRQPHPFTQGPVWDGGGSWDDGSYWGLSLRNGGDPGQLLGEIDYALHHWRPSGRSPRFLVIDFDGSTQVNLMPPYDFLGDPLIVPLFEAGELIRGAPTPFYSSSFVNP